MTKADKIRSMNDEQLADFLADVVGCLHCPIYLECAHDKSESECNDLLLAWLRLECSIEGENK